MHFILNKANEKNLVFQFHSGMHDGNGNYLHNSNPTLLTNLFFRYPDIKFDLFHISYPYQQELGALCKNFPNVFINMCWSHIISPIAAINTLIEYLEVVPINKISAFGGDFAFIDGVYGHLILTRQNVCRALTKKIMSGNIDIDKAKRISEMVFLKNPSVLYGF